MAIKLNRLRLTLIWAQAFPLNSASNSVIGSYPGYVDHFRKAQSNEDELGLPWRSGKEQHFWERYLNIKKQKLDGITEDRAWRSLVPLRAPTQVKFETPPEYRMSLEGLIYPHGVAAMATAYVHEDLPLNDMVKKVVNIRTHKQHTAIWQKTGQVDLTSLDNATARLLDWLYKYALGEAAERKEAAAPLTIVTPIDGSGVKLELVNESNGQVHRALEGLCVLNKYWAKKKLHNWDTSTGFQFKEKDYVVESHRVYALGRNCAIWFPGNFTEHLQSGQPLVPVNGCYHRNLSFASAQMETLLDLMNETVAWLEKFGESMPLATREIVRLAADILGRHYGGVKEAYMSWSIQRQIEGKRSVVDKVRAECGREPLYRQSSD